MGEIDIGHTGIVAFRARLHKSETFEFINGLVFWLHCASALMPGTVVFNPRLTHLRQADEARD
ncbi:MAG: hypothetical protein Q7T25_16765, partial [Sideroxyarcus sp.]|nr:hypothetical protein [Sideroxyarcus sp.]